MAKKWSKLAKNWNFGPILDHRLAKSGPIWLKLGSYESLFTIYFVVSIDPNHVYITNFFKKWPGRAKTRRRRPFFGTLRAAPPPIVDVLGMSLKFLVPFFMYKNWLLLHWKHCINKKSSKNGSVNGHQGPILAYFQLCSAGKFGFTRILGWLPWINPRIFLLILICYCAIE